MPIEPEPTPTPEPPVPPPSAVPTEATRRPKLEDYLELYQNVARDFVRQVMLEDFDALWPATRTTGY